MEARPVKVLVVYMAAEVVCLVSSFKLVVQLVLQKSDADPVKYQYEERLTNPRLMSTEVAVVHTALTCYSGKKECPVLLL